MWYFRLRRCRIGRMIGIALGLRRIGIALSDLLLIWSTRFARLWYRGLDLVRQRFAIIRVASRVCPRMILIVIDVFRSFVSAIYELVLVLIFVG